MRRATSARTRAGSAPPPASIVSRAFGTPVSGRSAATFCSTSGDAMSRLTPDVRSQPAIVSTLRSGSSTVPPDASTSIALENAYDEPMPM